MKFLFLILSVLSFSVHAINYDKCNYQGSGEKCFYQFDDSGKITGWAGPYPDPKSDQVLVRLNFNAVVIEDSNGKVIHPEGLQVDGDGKPILIDEMVDDKTKPLKDKRESELCEGQEACESLIASKTCTNATDEKLIDEDFTEVYCAYIYAYEQKLSGYKKPILDQARLDAYLAQKVKADELESTIQKGKNARQACDEVLAYVSGVNQQRVESGAITEAQTTTLETTFTFTFLWLSKGYPTKAKTAINAITVDGTLVTQAMIDAANSTFAKYGY